MIDYLRLWGEDLIARESASIKSRMRVTGELNQHLGPRWAFAKVQLEVEPATQFEVIDAVQRLGDLSVALQQIRFPDCVIFGLLDVLMTCPPMPVSKIRVVLESVDYDPIHSSFMAFRYAGRDAGRKIIEAA